MKLKEVNIHKDKFKSTILKFTKDLEVLVNELEPEYEKLFNKKFNELLKQLELVYIDIKDVKISSKTKQHTIATFVKTRIMYIENILTNANLDTFYEQQIVTDHLNILIKDLEK